MKDEVFSGWGMCGAGLCLHLKCWYFVQGGLFHNQSRAFQSLLKTVITSLVVGTHSFNLSIWETGGISEFEASLPYRVSSRATQETLAQKKVITEALGALNFVTEGTASFTSGPVGRKKLSKGPAATTI